jgi:hypothetical protein
VRPQRVRLALLGSAVVLVIAVVVSASRGGAPAPLPLPGLGRPAAAGDPFAYHAASESAFAARAASGEAQVLFSKSPGGVLATAARVAAVRPLIDAATAGTSVDPATLEGLVFVESAGRTDAVAGSDPSSAAGLTQILAETGQSLLGMHIDLARSRTLTAAIGRAAALGQDGVVARLERERARVDDRFDPRKALAATVRYLELSDNRFGRADLAVVSYHMGIGNLSNVLAAYDGGRPVPYAQLYFDSTPDRHGAAFSLLSGFGDDSSLYYWRVLGAINVMRLYRSDRGALVRLARLESAHDSAEEVLHPPDRTPSFADPDTLRAAYASRAVLPLPSDAARLGLAYWSGLGSSAGSVGEPATLYRGLRPAAIDLLIELAARVKALSGGAAPLIVAGAVQDRRYQAQSDVADPEAYDGYSLDTTGYAFDIRRSYVSRAQAVALQAMLDRLQALNLIAWVREADVIHVTVAGDASQVIARGL